LAEAEASAPVVEADSEVEAALVLPPAVSVVKLLEDSAVVEDSVVRLPEDSVARLLEDSVAKPVDLVLKVAPGLDNSKALRKVSLPAKPRLSSSLSLPNSCKC
jgi:hypothetical protein